MNEIITSFSSWAAEPATPNAVWFVVIYAAITRPSTWTKQITGFVERRFGGGE